MPLPNQNWTVSNQRPRGVMVTPPAGNAPLPPGITGGNAGYTREVQGNELASTHMEELGRGDNRILQQARQRGVMAGASRGGINSNLAAAGGEQAWLDAAGNVAMQQAGAYGTAAGQNLDSLRQQRMSAEGNQTSENVAGIGAGASMYASDNNLLSDRERNILERDRMGQDRELTLSGREFQTGERESTQGWQSGESQRDRDFTTGRDATQQGYTQDNMRRGYEYQQEGQDNELDRQIAGETYRDMLDNPEEWDEYMASGAVDFFTRYLNPRRRQDMPNASTQPVTDPNAGGP